MTDVKEIKKLREDIDKEISDLYDIQTVLRSLQIVLNYQETGKPYNEDDYY